MNTLDCLVYTSRAKLNPAEHQSHLADIVRVSSYRNADAGITGILTLQDGYFIQLLEATPAALDLLMLHLHFDKRHEDIKIVARDRIPLKAVTAWAMVSPSAGTAPHPRLTDMLSTQPSATHPWRAAMQELLGVPSKQQMSGPEA